MTRVALSYALSSGAGSPLRIGYRTGLEVELGLTTGDWLKTPLDADTVKAIAEGFLVLYDRDGVMSDAGAATRRCAGLDSPSGGAGPVGSGNAGRGSCVVPGERPASACGVRVVDEGFTRFVDEEYDTLRRALALYCGDVEVARELTQDAFARAYERWPRVRQMDRPGAWVQTVGFNLARSWFRRRQAERRAHGRHGPDPEAVATDVADGLSVRSAVAALPPRQREAIVLRYFLGRSVAETAVTLGIAETAVRAATFKGIDRLRTHLDVEQEEVADHA